MNASTVRWLAFGSVVALSALPAAPSSIPDRDPECQSLREPGAQERWVFLEYSTGEGGRVDDLKARFASDPSYGADIIDCASRGQFELSRNGRGQHQLFWSTRPSNAENVEGKRLVLLNLPVFEGLSGDLAIRLKVSREGKVLDKSLLFSTDDRLGELVLEHVEESLEILSRGENPGPFVDILSLKVMNGQRAVFLQKHYALKTF